MFVFDSTLDVNNLALMGSFTTLPSFEKEGILASPFGKGGLRGIFASP
jgi:hypothetical protein